VVRCSRSLVFGEQWRDPAGTTLENCTILTAPNAVISAVHDRMPVILDPDTYDLSLDPGMRDAGTVAELLKPHEANAMSCYPISTGINHVANARVELAQVRLS